MRKALPMLLAVGEDAPDCHGLARRAMPEYTGPRSLSDIQ